MFRLLDKDAATAVFDRSTLRSSSSATSTTAAFARSSPNSTGRPRGPDDGCPPGRHRLVGPDAEEQALTAAVLATRSTPSAVA